jgi:hypothetical protein
MRLVETLSDCHGDRCYSDFKGSSSPTFWIPQLPKFLRLGRTFSLVGLGSLFLVGCDNRHPAVEETVGSIAETTTLVESAVAPADAGTLSTGVEKEDSSPPKEPLGRLSDIDVIAAQRASSRLPPANREPAKPLTPEEERLREAARQRGNYTFDDLKFDIEKDQEFRESMLTDSVRALHDKKLRIKGYMLPASVFQLKGIKQFVLVRDNQECCFGPGAALYDCIMIEMAEGKSTVFSDRPVSVSGTMKIDTESFQYPDGGHYAIFRMTANEVK